MSWTTGRRWRARLGRLEFGGNALAVGPLPRDFSLQRLHPPPGLRKGARLREPDLHMISREAGRNEDVVAELDLDVQRATMHRQTGTSGKIVGTRPRGGPPGGALREREWLAEHAGVEGRALFACWEIHADAGEVERRGGEDRDHATCSSKRRAMA